MNSYYVVDSNPDGESIPYFFESEWSPELPSFELPRSSPVRVMFASRYTLKAKVESLSVDVLLGDFIASVNFVRLCESLEAEFISVPTEIVTARNTKVVKDYYFFCVTGRVSMLDRGASQFELMDDRLLSPRGERGDFDVFSRIDKFVIKEDVRLDFFYCEEIKRVVCSAKFKLEFESLGLTGLNFTEINDGFVYAPLEGF